MHSDWQAHRQALAEAQVWVMSRLHLGLPAEVLRSPELGTELLDYPDDWLYTQIRSDQVGALIQKRRRLLTKPLKPLQVKGRILCALDESDTAMGEGVPASGGVIDDTYLPAWDMWFAVLQLTAQAYESRPEKHQLLLAWIPDELVLDVQAAIEVAATEPIIWLDNAVKGSWHVTLPTDLDLLRTAQRELQASA